MSILQGRGHKHMRGMGWRPDLPDARDHMFAAEPAAKSPPLVDLRAYCPPVVDQGQYGSCTANAIVGALEFIEMKQKELENPLSRFFLYWNERAIEGSVGSDAGAYIRDGIKVAKSVGCCTEDVWPYIDANLLTKPTPETFAGAIAFEAIDYQRISHSTRQQKTCLAQGLPFVFGFTVYDSFMSAAVAASGIVPMPDLASETVQGGHAVLCVGYADSIVVGATTLTNILICRNSWGTGWGDAGYFYLPQAYLTDPNLSDDFWAISKVR